MISCAFSVRGLVVRIRKPDLALGIQRSLAAFLSVACLAGCAGKKRPPPNILLLLIDSLRADHLGFAGYDRPTSPCLDSLAAEGVAFTCCTAQAPYTLPSVPSLLSGRYPSSAVRWTSVTLPGGDSTFAAELGRGVDSIASILRAHGYRTSFINANSNTKYRLLGFRRQFDHVDESVTCKTGDCAARINARVVSWLSDEGQGPWFCYVHYMDVHLPYRAPARYARRFTGMYGGPPILEYANKKWTQVQEDFGADALARVVGMYDAEIAYLDSQIRELLGELEALGRSKNLLIVVGSDHGEELFERGGFGHGQTLYQEQIRCPLVFVWPGHIPRGTTVACTVRNIDILPTIVDLLSIPKGASIQGSTLVPYFRGDCPRRPIFSENRGYAVRLGDWKLWRERPGLLRLYNLQTDPVESVNVAAFELDTLRTLRSRLMAWRDSLPMPQEPASSEPAALPDKEAVEQLRALGYLD
jgi:arylsulfatase A-like enzyme